LCDLLELTEAVALSLRFVALSQDGLDISGTGRLLMPRELRVPPARSLSCIRQCGEMEILLRVGTAGRLLDFGAATTKAERAAVLAQRFRVYKRHGYHRTGLRVDRDEYDRKAVYFLATLAGGDIPALLLGSARLILGEPDPRFRFPVEKAFRLDLPEAIRPIPMCERAEVSRLVTERPEGIVLGSLLTPLGLMQTVSIYSRPRGIRCGLAPMKRRLLLALRGVGLPFHDLQHAGVSYPRRGAMAGYYYRHPDPVVPVYWLGHEMVPLIEQALVR